MDLRKKYALPFPHCHIATSPCPCSNNACHWQSEAVRRWASGPETIRQLFAQRIKTKTKSIANQPPLSLPLSRSPSLNPPVSLWPALVGKLSMCASPRECVCRCVPNSEAEKKSSRWGDQRCHHSFLYIFSPLFFFILSGYLWIKFKLNLINKLS